MSSAIRTFGQVIEALVERELKTRFGQYKFGAVWLLAEPLFHVAIFAILFGMRKSDAFIGVEPPVFIAASIVPFVMFQSILKRCQSAVSGNSGLFIYRPVKPLNALIARLLVELVIYLLVGAVVVGVLEFLGLSAVPTDLMLLALYVGLLVVFSFGVGVIFCVAESVKPELAKVTAFIMKPLFFISAVLYPLSIIPHQFHVYLTWNPLVHAMELIRESWLVDFPSTSVSLAYLSASALISLFLGMVLYRAFWKQVIAS